MLAAALRPALAADYRQAEIELSQRFTDKLSMEDILAALDAARLEQGEALRAADAALTLYGRVREHLAATPAARGEGVTRSGRQRRPWTERELTARASARRGELLDSARRAVALAAVADTGRSSTGGFSAGSAPVQAPASSTARSRTA